MCTCTEKMTFLGKDDHSIVEWGGGHLEECTRPNLTQPLVAYINFEVQKKNFSLEPIFTLYPPPKWPITLYSPHGTSVHYILV